MDPRLAIVTYRHRVEEEHLISSLKSVINVDPLRVWAAGSTRGKLVLGLISQFLLSMLIHDMGPDVTIKVIDGKSVETRVKPTCKTVTKELRRYQGIVYSQDWGGFEIQEVFDGDILNNIVTVLERYASEPPIEVPSDLDWRADPPAQWGAEIKNCKDLAMSIAQCLSEKIFPEFMKGRSHWKDIDPRGIGVFTPSTGLDPESLGALGLRAERRRADVRKGKGRKKGPTAQ